MQEVLNGILAFFLFVLTLILIIFFSFMVVIRIIRYFWHFPIPSFLARAMNSRLAMSLRRSKRIINQSGVHPRLRCVDLGCGPGSFTLDFARLIGNSTILHAVDIQWQMIEKLKKKLISENMKNVEAIIASAHHLPYLTKCMDMVMMISVIAEIPDRQSMLKEISRILHSKGLLSISESITDPDYPLRRSVKQWCTQAGYKLKFDSGQIWTYTLRFQKE